MAQVKEKAKIERPHLIICEGVDARNFIREFLNSCSESNSEYKNFQAIDGGGNDQLPKFFKTLPNLPEFSGVKSITIIRDAEKSAHSASQSI